MFTQAYGEEMMAVIEGRPSHACVIVRTSVHTIHTSVFSFTMFTATAVLCSSIKVCLQPEISRNNYPGILKIHQGNIKDLCLLEMLGTLLQYMCVIIRYCQY